MPSIVSLSSDIYCSGTSSFKEFFISERLALASVGVLDARISGLNLASNFDYATKTEEKHVLSIEDKLAQLRQTQPVNQIGGTQEDTPLGEKEEKTDNPRVPRSKH